MSTGKSHKTVVVDVPGLSKGLLNRNREHAPFLCSFSGDDGPQSFSPAFPALTCTAQATFLTGKGPKDHGITANGWYDKDYNEVKNWHQSAGCVKEKRVWDDLKAYDPDATVFVNGWWHGMHDPSIDFLINVRPQYLQNGGKKPDVYTKPSKLRDKLQHEFGTFPLHKFWGPTTGIASSKWIADSRYGSLLKYERKFGPLDTKHVPSDLEEIDRLLSELVSYYEGRAAHVIILSEYGISPVDHVVYLNRILRESGYLELRHECGGTTLDCGECRAFALCDHQVAHIHIRHEEDIMKVKKLLNNVPGVEKVLTEKELDAMYSDSSRRNKPSAHHRARSGDLIVIAEPHRCVAIHRKPGYDPAEMYFRFPHPWGFLYLLLKVLLVYVFHIRTTVDATPLQCDSIRGSHGRLSVPESELPIVMLRNLRPTDIHCAEDIRHLIWEYVVISTK